MLEAEFPRTFPRIAPADQPDKITVAASISSSTLPRVIPEAPHSSAVMLAGRTDGLASAPVLTERTPKAELASE